LKTNNPPSSNLSDAFRPSKLIHKVHEFIGKLLPAFLRMGTGLVRANREGGVEEEHARVRPGLEIAVEGWELDGMRAKGKKYGPVRRRNEAGVLGCQFFVDVAERGRNLDSRSDREAKTW
jgi:hypothetical protein